MELYNLLEHTHLQNKNTVFISWAAAQGSAHQLITRYTTQWRHSRFLIEGVSIYSSVNKIEKEQSSIEFVFYILLLTSSEGM